MKTTILFGILFLVCCSQQITGFPIFDEGCGIKEDLAANYVGVAGENETYSNHWPWLVGIFDFSKDPEEKSKFRCSGTLISKKHILTATQCVLIGGKKPKEGRLSVSLGNSNFEIGEIKLYRVRGLALLILKNPIEPSNEHRPICLWEGSRELKKIIGQKGIVIGWGENRHTYKDEPRIMSPKIVSEEICSRSLVSHKLPKFSFCARDKNKAGPCIKDHGSTFILQDHKTGRYYLRGILRTIFSVGKRRQCNSKKYAIYLDLTNLRRWLKRHVSRDLTK